jgi:hypothetical protein
LTAADLNGNGTSDLAVANRGSGSITILLGDGAGGFTGSTSIAVGGAPTSIVAAHFNADPAIDLAVAVGDSVVTLMGDGRGGFFPNQGVRIPPGTSSASAVTTGDFNADDIVDLAWADATSKSLSIWLGNGGGEFTRSTEANVGENPRSLLAADINQDGHDDVVVVSELSDSVSVTLGDGNGGFIHAFDFGAGTSPMNVAVGDLDADGEVDLVVPAFIENGYGAVVQLLNQITLRSDVNESNRVDGFDVALVSTRAASTRGETGYRVDADVNLDGRIDGDDLCWIALRFGELNRKFSPLRPSLSPTLVARESVTLQPLARATDVLTVGVVANTAGRVAGALFDLVFDPAVLAFDEYVPGDFFSGSGIRPFYSVDDSQAGRLRVAVLQFNAFDVVTAEPRSLLNVSFRAKQEGETTIDFAASPQPELRDAQEDEVPGLTFVGGDVIVESSPDSGASRRIDVFPGTLDFAPVEVGTSARRELRVYNRGFSDLRILDVESSAPEFTSFFVESFTIPAFGFVRLGVVFSADHTGIFEGELAIESDDPQNDVVTVELRASVPENILGTGSRKGNLSADGLNQGTAVQPASIETQCCGEKSVLAPAVMVSDGDIDGNRRIDGFDFFWVVESFGLQSNDPGFDPDVDVNDDGWIDGDDIAVVASLYSRTY